MLIAYNEGAKNVYKNILYDEDILSNKTWFEQNY